MQITSDARVPDGKDKRDDKVPPPLPLDLADIITGMYRLLDLISEIGSNGCGKEFSNCNCMRRN
jgi:hypothetical protein